MQQKIDDSHVLTKENTDAELLIEGYYESIFTYCYRILRNRQDAEDVTQEVFISALESGKMPAIENKNAWLYKIAYYKCMNKVKRSKLLYFLPFTEKREANLIYEDEDESGLQAILVQLKPPERALLVLRIVEGQSFDEIGAIMNISTATARKRYERLKVKIKRLIEGERKNEEKAEEFQRVRASSKG